MSRVIDSEGHEQVFDIISIIGTDPFGLPIDLSVFRVREEGSGWSLVKYRF